MFHDAPELLNNIRVSRFSIGIEHSSRPTPETVFRHITTAQCFRYSSRSVNARRLAKINGGPLREGLP